MKNKLSFIGLFLSSAVTIFFALFTYVQAATINVTIGDNLFQQKNVNINQGDVVVWTQTGQHPHTVTADNSSFDSGTLAGGSSATFSHTFNSAGTFSYYCAFHGGPGGVGMSGSVVVQSIQASPPSVPTNLSATAVSSSQINLSWTASTDSVGVTGYKVFRNSSQIATPSNNSYSDTGLTASTSYTYTVSAFNAAGNNSAQSASVNATTQNQVILPVISNLVASNITASTAQLSWSTNVSTNGQVFYGLTTSYGLSSALFDDNSKTTTHTIVLSGMTATTTYHFKVTSTDGFANSTTSPDSFFTTLTLPPTPTPTPTPAPTPMPVPTPIPLPTPTPIINPISPVPSGSSAGVSAGLLSMPGPTTGQTLPTGTLVNDNGTIVLIRGNMKILFTSMRAFTGLGYKLSNVIKADLSNYQLTNGYSISNAKSAHPWSSWLLYHGTIYYSHKTGLIGVPSWNIFLNNGGLLKYVLPANPADLKVLRSSSNLPILEQGDSRVYK